MKPRTMLCTAVLALLLVSTGAEAQSPERWSDVVVDIDVSSIFVGGVDLASEQQRLIMMGFVCPAEESRPPIVFIEFGGVLVGDARGEVDVRVRFDQWPATPIQKWRLAKDKRLIVVTVGSQVVEELQAAASLLLLITDPHDGAERRLRFTMQGFRESFRKMRCNSG
jgi:hypothetical protein